MLFYELLQVLYDDVSILALKGQFFLTKCVSICSHEFSIMVIQPDFHSTWFENAIGFFLKPHMQVFFIQPELMGFLLQPKWRWGFWSSSLIGGGFFYTVWVENIFFILPDCMFFSSRLISGLFFQPAWMKVFLNPVWIAAVFFVQTGRGWFFHLSLFWTFV